MSSLLCLGRHTVTGLLTTSGAQFHDWTAAYRLFSTDDRLPTREIFAVVRRQVAEHLPPEAPFRAVIDDSLLRRAGSRTPGVAWRRDPLGPRFQTNLVRAQRVLQVSAALPGIQDHHRLIPIAFQHVPTPPKPSRKADETERQKYQTEKRQARLSLRAQQQIQQLRQDLDRDAGSKHRQLLMAFDGGYTNATVMKHLPERTIAIGRLRKDAQLFWKPEAAAAAGRRGRRAQYGERAPTPEQFRTQAQPGDWQTMIFHHSGVEHSLRFRHIPNVMWRAAGAQRTLQLIVIAPLGYRLRKAGRLMFRDPAYLVCSDTNRDPRQIIEAYFQRWEIEVNFREEKTLLGVGQAQVRAARSVETAPALGVASYALLLLAARRAFGESRDGLLPQPKWAARATHARSSTQQLLHQLRAEVWGHALGIRTFSGFALTPTPVTKPEKCAFPLASAVCFANG